MRNEAIDWAAVTLPGIEGGAIDPDRLRGKVVLAVNTASFCGFTPQYAALQAQWQAYRDRGLMVVGLPSNDFAGQEPDDEGQIRYFCRTTFGIDFPMTAKVHVRGPQAHPLYVWAATQTSWLGRPHWNFHKLLIGRDGRLSAWFSTVTSPSSARMRRAIDRALARPAG